MYSAFISHISGRLEEVLTQGLEFVNWSKNVQSGSVVFVKPNFTFPSYSKGVTTSPKLLKLLLEKLKDRSNRIIVGESNGGNHSFTAEEAFQGHDMYKICRDTGVELVNLSKLPCRFVESRIQGKKVKVQLPELLINDIDCFISVPTLKVHVMTRVSLGLKNMWGCYPDTMRGLNHQNIAHKLTLLAKTLNPKLTIIDGLYGLDGHGPMFGNPVETNLMIASDNVVVADTLGSQIMRQDVKKVRHIQIAEKEGIGTTELSNVRINTDWRQYSRTFYVRKTVLDVASTLLFESDVAAKLVMSSAFTPLIYKIAGTLKTPAEKALGNELKKRGT
jgi:uncharacterized protein (DUF362 family)